MKSTTKKGKRTTNVGEAIRRLRGECALTQAELAKEIGITHGSIYRYESGQTVPDMTTLRRLLAYAAERGNTSGQVAFTNEIRDRTGLAVPPVKLTATPEDAVLYTIERNPNWPIQSLIESTRWLTREENVLLLALARMLKSSPDPAQRTLIREVLSVFVRNYIPAAEAEFARSGPVLEVRKGLFPSEVLEKAAHIEVTDEPIRSASVSDPDTPKSQ